jgi:uncharacterized protein YprB with RNaseH-like and TPR domain
VTLQNIIEAYLDIETTGLSPQLSEITVVGIYITGGEENRFIQFVGKDINGDSIMESMKGVKRLYTYNGHRFDLPFIYIRHGVSLEQHFEHHDLMNKCWERNLYGGLKVVERCLGIERRIKEVNGLEAVRLWWQYVNNYDESALKTLLEYNKEDVVNLKTLRDILQDKP